jgi:hypothetical protein
VSKQLQLGAIAVVAFAILADLYTPRLLRYRELSDARARWTVCGIDDYRWTIDIGGFLLGGRIHLDVRDARAVHADADTVLPPRGTYPRTVEELFDGVGRAAGSDRFHVTYDADCGYPTRLSVDPSRFATDDEYESP